MKRFALVSIASVFVLLVVAGSARSADLMFMTATGQSQGLIKGGVKLEGLVDYMKVTEYHHEVFSPRDPASGLPTGRRQHKPLLVRIPVDKATPQLMAALVNNENLPTLEVKFMREVTTRVGEKILRNVFNVQLVNASVGGVATVNPDSAGATAAALTELSFYYQKIRWTWVGGGSAEDDWEAPVALQ